jgi:hypothetical protein
MFFPPYSKSFAADFAQTFFASVGKGLVGQSGRLAAFRADKHNLAGVDGAFDFDKSAFFTNFAGLDVLGGNVAALNDHFAFGRAHFHHFARLAFISAGDDDDLIAGFDMYFFQS